MKAITFLGVSKYEETTYEYHQQQVTTKIFPSALPKFFPNLQQVLVFVTPKVHEDENFTALQDSLGDLMYTVDIPNGRTEGELWDIFDAMIENVQQGDDLIFDITHSFRSLPFLTFLVAAFLRVAREVKVHHVLYGAFQAKEDQSKITPVFDLSPFVDLLDWITATQQLLQTGNAQKIAELLKEAGMKNKQALFKDTGTSLEEITSQLLLCHPLEVMEDADKLSKRLNKTPPISIVSLKPFYLLLNTIQKDYASRAETEPENNVAHSLQIQFDLIRWYAEKGLMMQAITLAREWIVNSVGWKMNQAFVLERNQREEIERGLSGLARTKRGETSMDSQELNHVGMYLLQKYENYQTLAKVYDSIVQMRNDVNHAGMNTSRVKAKSFVQKFKNEILPVLEEFNLWVR